jgi:hypothetical protein
MGDFEDNLSRLSSRTKYDETLVKGAQKSMVSGALRKWLRAPSTDWNLPYILLGEVIEKLKL